jgi:hypothetical protein
MLLSYVPKLTVLFKSIKIPRYLAVKVADTGNGVAFNRKARKESAKSRKDICNSLFYFLALGFATGFGWKKRILMDVSAAGGLSLRLISVTPFFSITPDISMPLLVEG